MNKAKDNFIFKIIFFMKKTYWLTLWWWAARWFAHIWVLKYIEEKNIKINEISWTSMWAIIWALFAIWKKSDEIEEIAKSLNIVKLLDFDMKEGFLKWIKIYKKFEEIFWDKKIEETKIPLKIVATNIETWEKKVFENWKIIDALRASISLPWILKPYKIWEELFVDWWISSNLPIEFLSWENIIAVSALKNVKWKINLRKKIFWIDFSAWIFKVWYEIIHRTILIMMKQNEEKSIKYSNKEVILIEPDYKDLDYYNFNKIDWFIEAWYESIKKKKIF